MSETKTEPVVVVYHTIMDGPVVRWYVSETSAKCGQEFMSASRNGVRVHAFLHEVDEELLATAEQVRRDLAKGRDVERLATHRAGVLSGDLSRVERSAEVQQ